MLSSPELYAKAFPHSWEAEQFCAGQFNLSTLTTTILYPNYGLKTTPTYAQGAGSGLGKKKRNTQGVLATEVVRDGDREIQAPSSLPWASRGFFAAKTNPGPYTLLKA